MNAYPQRYPWWLMIFPAALLILSWLMACYGGKEEAGPVARFALWLTVFLHFDVRLRQIRDR